ncbi:unnamed protein product [Spirodela intermedia]|uniref:Uncharacterized protein n=1 Tax=Spirodela intermedia TaxID=51605 RepID=A0A7I8IMT8_SPIIN|nr:unnamed protein product [Spirodela intermedia]CAA6659109.1 unnamed protein product [Spirodela intermedia]
MGESGESISIDMEMISFGGQEFAVETSTGSVLVSVCGDQERPALITYSDVALNCLYVLLPRVTVLPGADSLLLQNFCIYHINAPGMSVDDLADQVAEVLDFFEVKKVICLGVLAGAYILTLFSMKYRERAAGLILVSPLCRAPSWTECLLYFYGICGCVKELLILRFFSEEVRCGTEGAKSDALQACEGYDLLDDRQSSNVIRFLIAINRRCDLTENLKELQCKTLIFVGERSPFYSEARHMIEKMGCASPDLIEIHACGSLVTEEQPDAMLVPLEIFLESFGFFRRTSSALRHGSRHSRPASPPGLGIKLKPIKTRTTVEA